MVVTYPGYNCMWGNLTLNNETEMHEGYCRLFIYQGITSMLMNPIMDPEINYATLHECE